MSEGLIRQAFETVLSAWAASQSPAVPVAWQNVSLVPQPTGRYLRTFLLPANSFSEDIGRRHTGFSGIYQISVCAPTGTGNAEGEALAASLRALFPASVPLTAGGLTVNITDPLSVGPSTSNATHQVFACSLPYRADSFV